MDRDLKYIIRYITRLTHIYNLLGYLNTLTYDNVYFLQSKIRKRLKYIEEDLGIDVQDCTNIPLVSASMTDKKYLKIDE